MSLNNIFLMFVLFYCMFNTNFFLGRSLIRKSHQKKPKIEVRWKKKPNKKHFLISTQLQKGPIFDVFDEKFFHQNLLPEKINYRYNKKTYVKKQKLEEKLEHLFNEIKQKKRKYEHFKILRKSNFNRRKKSGLLILKFKDYPFVVKIFMEKPKSFIKPYSKGLYPIFFFNMGGGINRHLLGFTRIKNLHEIEKIIEKNPEWQNKIETPRKWHWKPKNCKEIEIIGKNFHNDNGKKEIKTTIPGIYCVIADEIKLKNKNFSLFDTKAKQECMSLCNSLDLRIDPHIDNFLLEKDTDKIVIIDTEHFPSIVGLKGQQKFSSYLSWYYSLSVKCLNDMFFKTKKERFIA